MKGYYMPAQTLTADQNRIYYLDLLRIIATLGVMVLHISGEGWAGYAPDTGEWMTLNVFECFVRWTVPMFVMISGTLFLNFPIKTRDLYKTNILRIASAFVFWTVLYAIIDLMLEPGMTKQDLLFRIVQGKYHLWFLFMIIGLYIIVPLLKKIAESYDLIRYFLIVSLIFSFIIPQAMGLIGQTGSEWYGVLNYVRENSYFNFTLGYVSYFVLGYYLFKTEIPGIVRKIIYLLAIASFVFTIFASSAVSNHIGSPSQLFYGHFTLNTLLEDTGIFVFFKYNAKMTKAGTGIKKFIADMSKYSFGAYLVHVFFIDRLKLNFGITVYSGDPLLLVILITAVVFTASFIVSFLLNRIPVLNRYIV